MTDQKEINGAKSFRILIVEDNKVNQLLVGNMLKNFGFAKFDCADNGKIALEKLKTTKYDLVLMDIQMPEMNGYEITIEIRANLPEPIRRVPIIALSANASTKEKEYAHEAGMDDFIVKPYSPEELYTAIASQIKISESDNSVFPPELEKMYVNNKAVPLQSLEKYTAGDNELEIQLIEIFLRQIPEAIHKLETFIPEANWKHVYNIAHKIKGSIAIFELHELKKTLILIEDYSRLKTNLEQIPVLFIQFKKLCQSTVVELETQLEKLKMEDRS